MTGTSQLAVFNRCLGMFGERALSQSEITNSSREPARQMNAEWTSAVDYCMAQGNWKHALRAVQLVIDPSNSVQFGYSQSFDEPSDWVRTYQLSEAPDFSVPNNNYLHQQGKFFVNCTTIYLNYVSNGTAYGYNISRWRPGFAEYVAAELADRIKDRITQSEKVRQEVELKVKKKRSVALSNDAFDDPPKRMPTGSWVQARRRGGGFPGTLPDTGW